MSIGPETFFWASAYAVRLEVGPTIKFLASRSVSMVLSGSQMRVLLSTVPLHVSHFFV